MGSSKRLRVSESIYWNICAITAHQGSTCSSRSIWRHHISSHQPKRREILKRGHWRYQRRNLGSLQRKRDHPANSGRPPSLHDVEGWSLQDLARHMGSHLQGHQERRRRSPSRRRITNLPLELPWHHVLDEYRWQWFHWKQPWLDHEWFYWQKLRINRRAMKVENSTFFYMILRRIEYDSYCYP